MNEPWGQIIVWGISLFVAVLVIIALLLFGGKWKHLPDAWNRAAHPKQGKDPEAAKRLGRFLGIWILTLTGGFCLLFVGAFLNKIQLMIIAVLATVAAAGAGLWKLGHDEKRA